MCLDGRPHWSSGVYKPAVTRRCVFAAASLAFRLAAVLRCSTPLLTALSISLYASEINFSIGFTASSEVGRVSELSCSSTAFTTCVRHQGLLSEQHSSCLGHKCCYICRQSAAQTAAHICGQQHCSQEMQALVDQYLSNPGGNR